MSSAKVIAKTATKTPVKAPVKAPAKTSAPVFDETKMTLLEYVELVKEYEIEVNKDKYNNVLGLLCDILSVNHKSLMEIRPFMKKTIIDNKKHLIATVEKWHDKFPGIQLDVDRLEADTMETNEPTIIMYLRQILKTINYSIRLSTRSNVRYYTVKLSKS